MTGRRHAAIIALLLGLAACTPASTSGVGDATITNRFTRGPSASARLDAVLADPRREQDRARDAWRHPKETLELFGVRPSDVVAEVYPGGGWYTRIVAPYVGENGGYLAIEYSRRTHEQLSAGRTPGSVRAQIDDFLASYPDEVRAYAPGRINVVGAYAFDEIPPQLHGTVDAVLFIRALHNLKRTDALSGALAETYALLKPGGIVGVEQHRARPDADDQYASGAKGYLREADVIAAFEAAGFVLEAASEINANPADPADWPNGVWTLPPELALGLLNRDRYLAIGESDRMTLKFRKPG